MTQRMDGKRVLCFGDSLTYGYIPAGRGKRYRSQDRWTCQLGEITGATVIEDGMNGRTSIFVDPYLPGTCGAEAVDVAIEAAGAADAIVVMLGINDLKDFFDHTAEQVADGVMEIVDRLSEGIPSASVLVVCPPAIDPCVKAVDPTLGMMECLNDKSIIESGRLAEPLRRCCEGRGYAFLDANESVRPSAADGVHLSVEGNRAMAKAVAEALLADGD